MKKPFSRISIDSINTNSYIKILHFLNLKMLDNARIIGIYAEDIISISYFFNIWIYIDKNINKDLKNHLGKKIYFYLDYENKKDYFIGFLKTIEFFEDYKNTNKNIVSLEIYSEIQKLDMNKISFVYNKNSFIDILSNIFKKYKITLENKIIQKCNKEDFCIQIEESYLNFILRSLNKNKCILIQDKLKSSCDVIVTDNINKIKNIGNVYIEPINFSYSKFTKNFKITKYSFEEININEKISFNDPNVIEQITGAQNFNIFNNFYNTNDNEDGSWALSGKKYLFSGQKFEYNNEIFICIKSFIKIDNTMNENIIFISKNIHINSINFKLPILSQQSAIVFGDNNNEIISDKLGRVKLKFMWSKNEFIFARTCNVISGRNFGFFFVPRVGQEVIVSFLHNNIDEPFIIGTLYNQLNAPFIHKNRNSVSYIKTETIGKNESNKKYKNMILFDDKINDEKIEISSSKDLNLFSSERINIHNELDFSITSSKGKFLTIKIENGCLKIDSKYFETNINDKIILSSKGDIEIKSLKNIKINSNNNIILDAKNSIELKSNNKIQLSSSNINIKSNLNLNMSANLNLDIKSNISTNINSSLVKINGKAKCDISSLGMLTVDGSLSRFVGKLTSIEGLLVKIN